MTVAETTPHEPVWTLGERLAKARKDKGLNQEQMAELLEVSKSAIAKWEADRGEPRHLLDTVNEWAGITGASVAWLLGVNAHNPGSDGHMTYMELLPPLLGQMELALTQAANRAHSDVSATAREGGAAA